MIHFLFALVMGIAPFAYFLGWLTGRASAVGTAFTKGVHAGAARERAWRRMTEGKDAAKHLPFFTLPPI